MSRTRSLIVGLVAGVAGVVVETGASAQVTGDQAISAASTMKSNLPPDSFGGEAMFGKIDEDFFVTLALRINFDREYWGVGFQLPLRLRVIDNDPKKGPDTQACMAAMDPSAPDCKDDFGGILRREDWDEPTDFLRVLRYVYVGRADKKGPFYVRVGELSGLTIGHGTIMYRYFNGLDLDTWHTGVNAAVNIDAFGVVGMTGDIANPYLVGGRFLVRPLQLAMGEGWPFDALHFGVSLIGDTRAPYELETELVSPDPMVDCSAVPRPASCTETLELDEDSHPIVKTHKRAVVMGADVGFELVSTELISITPYIDLNKIARFTDGWGLHMGILWGLHFPLLIDTLVIDARTEYRRVSGDYVGPYFNTSYEIERSSVLSSQKGSLPVPKLRAVEGGVGSKNGVFFDLLAGLPQFVFVGGQYIDYDGGQDDGELRLSLEVPALEIVKFSAFYYRVNMNGKADDFFKLDDRSAIVASAQIPIYYVFSLNLRWWRVWQAQQDPSTSEVSYEAVDDWSVGVGFSLEL